MPSEGAAPVEIVTRLINVLEQAVASLTRTDDGPIISASSEPPPLHRFDSFTTSSFGPSSKQAYSDSRRALDQQQV